MVGGTGIAPVILAFGDTRDNFSEGIVPATMANESRLNRGPGRSY